MQPLIPPHIAADRLGVTRGTVLNMARDGRLKVAARVAGKRGAYLFTTDEIARVNAEDVTPRHAVPGGRADR